MLNNITLQGRMTKTPELKKTDGGMFYTKFTVANSNKTKSGEEKTEFIDCVAWTKTAENICKFFEKGKEILITGRLSTRTYEDNNGNKVKLYEIIVGTFDFTSGTAAKKEESTTAEETDAKLPFSLVD